MTLFSRDRIPLALGAVAAAALTIAAAVASVANASPQDGAGVVAQGAPTAVGSVPATGR